MGRRIGHPGEVTDTYRPKDRSPAEILLDLVFFAPLGATIEFWEHLPDFARVGRDTFNRQRPAARMIGEFAVRQGRRRLERGLFGDEGPPSSGPPAGSGTGAGARGQDSPGPGDAGPPDLDGGTGSIPSELPIANYDALSAVQIVPLLAELSPGERDLIAAHERTHRGRRTVLGKLDQLARREASSGG